MNKSEDTQFQLLRQLEREPRLNQRRLAERLGLSLGKVNYCVRALVARGLVKISNFKRSDRKIAYAYLLTPAGFQEKARLTAQFLRTKQQQYECLRAEIAELQGEVANLERRRARQRAPR